MPPSALRGWGFVVDHKENWYSRDYISHIDLYRIWPKIAIASHTHRTPIHLVQHMARTPSEERKPTTPTIADDQAKELKRLDTILRISADLKSRELRDQFRQIVINGEMTKAAGSVQRAEMLEEKRKRDDEVEVVEADLESLRHEVSQGAQIGPARSHISC